MRKWGRMDETRTKCPRRSELKLGQEVWRESMWFLLLAVICSVGGRWLWVENGTTSTDQPCAANVFTVDLKWIYLVVKLFVWSMLKVVESTYSSAYQKHLETGDMQLQRKKNEFGWASKQQLELGVDKINGVLIWRHPPLTTPAPPTPTHMHAHTHTLVYWHVSKPDSNIWNWTVKYELVQKRHKSWAVS